MCVIASVSFTDVPCPYKYTSIQMDQYDFVYYSLFSLLEKNQYDLGVRPPIYSLQFRMYVKVALL